MAKTHPRIKEPLDPWASIAHEFPEAAEGEDQPNAQGGLPSNRVGVAEAARRLFFILWMQPLPTLMNLIGFVYGALSIYYFARGNMLETYGLVEGTQEAGELHIDPNTPVINQWGALLIVIWAVLPPLWFFMQYYVLSKTAEQKLSVGAAQQLTIKFWLATLAVMAILARP